MPTCYMVSSGDYSDYRVHAIFSTRQKAQAAIDAVHGSLYEIEEIELDPEYCNPYKGCRYYFVTAHKRRWPTELPISFTTDEGQLPRALGGVFEVYEIDSHQRGAVRFNKLQEDTGGPSLKMDGMALSLSRSYRLVGWEATTIVIAESKEAAIKVANERVMQAIARGELEAFHKKHGIVSPT